MLPKLHDIELDNGFRAILVPRRGLPIVAVTTWYRVGSRDERTGETGLSHFLEHMMFKGTGRYAKGEIDLLTSRLGGSNNAATDQDTTTYYFTLAADRWETALEIEADRMRNCALDPREFEAEKQVVLEELAMGEDDPLTVLFHEVDSLAYQVHPYHHPIIGWKEDLERLDVASMRDYYARHYGPNRAFLVAAGDLDPKRSASKIRELFGGLPAAAPRELPLAEPAATGERRVRIRTPGPLTRIALIARTCRMGERDDFTLDLIVNVLGSGKASRLQRRLVLEEELATHVSVFNHSRLDPGIWGVWAELRPGADAERAETCIREEIDRLCRDGLTATELRRARVQVCSSYLFEDETVLDLALKIGRFESACERGYPLLDDVIPTYDSIGRAEIRRVASRYSGIDGWNVVYAVPREAPPATAQRASPKKPTKKAKRSSRKPAAQTRPKRKKAKKRRKQPSRTSAQPKQESTGKPSAEER